jgi:hypothetical protein
MPVFHNADEMHYLLLQTALRDANSSESPHVCRLPGTTCSPASVCAGSQVTYSLAKRTANFLTPADKDGEIIIFTEPSGNVVVTIAMECNCFLSVVGANGNTVHLGPNYFTDDAADQAANCPARLNDFSDPTATAAYIAPQSLYSCMSWVLPKDRVQEALAASAVPGTVAISMHFAASCYSSCGSTVSGYTTATHVISSGPAEDIRCDLAPFRGVVYKVPETCSTAKSLSLPKAPLPPPSYECSSSSPQHCKSCTGDSCLKETCAADSPLKVGGAAGLPSAGLWCKPYILHIAQARSAVFARCESPDASEQVCHSCT